MATNVPVTLDTLIVVKIQLQGTTRRFKVPLRDLGANVFPDKVRCDAAVAVRTGDPQPGRATRAYRQLRGATLPRDVY